MPPPAPQSRFRRRLRPPVCPAPQSGVAGRTAGCRFAAARPRRRRQGRPACFPPAPFRPALPARRVRGKSAAAGRRPAGIGRRPRCCPALRLQTGGIRNMHLHGFLPHCGYGFTRGQRGHHPGRRHRHRPMHQFDF